jgi:citrate lyase synthetase
VEKTTEIVAAIAVVIAADETVVVEAVIVAEAVIAADTVDEIAIDDKYQNASISRRVKTKVIQGKVFNRNLALFIYPVTIRPTFMSLPGGP